MPSVDTFDPNHTYNEAQDSMELLPNYYKWTYGVFKHYIAGMVVELGCGAGHGIRTYLDRVQFVHAVDHDAELLRRVREAFPTRRVRPVQADLLGSWAELKGIAADTVIMMDVLEHFENDSEFLRKARSLLRPGGRLCVKVPAQERLFSEMDRASGHYRRYDPERIESLASSLDLRPLQIRSLNQVGALAYFLKQRERRNFSKTFSSFQLRAINSLLPFIAIVDRVQLFPGLSLMAVFES